MASFADVHYCIYADMVGGSEKVQNYAEIIYGWSLMKQCCVESHFFSESRFARYNILFESKGLETYCNVKSVVEFL